MKHNITAEGFEIFTCFVDCNLSSQVLVLNFKNCLIDAVTVLLLVMGSVFLNSLFTFFIILLENIMIGQIFRVEITWRVR